MDAPYFFVDEMVKGAFTSFKHEHRFNVSGSDTKMLDIFTFKSPCGVLGRLANVLFLKRYLHNLLRQRNLVIKHFAEQQAN